MGIVPCMSNATHAYLIARGHVSIANPADPLPIYVGDLGLLGLIALRHHDSRRRCTKAMAAQAAHIAEHGEPTREMNLALAKRGLIKYLGTGWDLTRLGEVSLGEPGRGGEW